MIKIENFEVFGWEHAIRGMRNPMNSWEKSDSDYRSILCEKCEHCETYELETWEDCYDCDVTKIIEDMPPGFMVGPNDHELMSKLAAGGPVHAKYRRMITVYVDITAPLYWWKEFDTYKVGTVANSCSTMHKIHDKEFTIEDFSCEHLIDSPIDETIAKEFKLDYEKYKSEDAVFAANDECGYLAIGTENYVDYFSPKGVLELFVISALNANRNAYLKTKDEKYWWQMIQLLPSSYNQKRTIMLNYEVLAAIYKWRKSHKLYEWIEFCEWIESLPYSELITGRSEEK